MESQPQLEESPPNEESPNQPISLEPLPNGFYQNGEDGSSEYNSVE